MPTPITTACLHGAMLPAHHCATAHQQTPPSLTTDCKQQKANPPVSILYNRPIYYHRQPACRQRATIHCGYNHTSYYIPLSVSLQCHVYTRLAAPVPSCSSHFDSEGYFTPDSARFGTIRCRTAPVRCERTLARATHTLRGRSHCVSARVRYI